MSEYTAEFTWKDGDKVTVEFESYSNSFDDLQRKAVEALEDATQFAVVKITKRT